PPTLRVRSPDSDPAAWAEAQDTAFATGDPDDDSLFSDFGRAPAGGGGTQAPRAHPAPRAPSRGGALETPPPGPAARPAPFPWRVALLLGGTALGLLALVLAYALDGGPRPTPRGPRAPALLLVDHSGEADRFPSIRAALEKAIPGDH